MPAAGAAGPAARNLVLYEVFVRQHGPGGRFEDVVSDLPRIRALGTDIVWLMPIHPIGARSRKGTLGSPYAIRDYRAVNPDLGSREDLAALVRAAADAGMRVMLDVVFNHASPDSRLALEHPEWFHRDGAGRPMTTVPEWSDVVDLRHPHPDLAEELISTLEDWVRLGVAGFRCDVASLVPPAFWRTARARVEAVRPGVTWLAESVHAAWVAERRARGLFAVSDGELYGAGFDLTYDYDIWPLFEAAVAGDVPVARYLEAARFQDAIYPETAAKLRCVENHDTARIMALAGEPSRAIAWTALAAFNRGAFLVHAGQEAGATHTPSLFERDPIRWNGHPLQGLLSRLGALKKTPAQVQGRLRFLAAEPLIQAAWEHGEAGLYGAFNVSGAGGTVPVQLPDGHYRDLLTDREVPVRGGRIPVPADAAVLAAGPLGELRGLFSPLLDYGLAREED